jgi:hypothetical protein
MKSIVMLAVMSDSVAVTKYMRDQYLIMLVEKGEGEMVLK